MCQSLNIRHKKSLVYLYSNHRYSKLTTCTYLSTFHKLTFCNFFVTLQFPGFITLYGKHKKFNNTTPYGCEPDTL